MTEILNLYDTITLDEMRGIRLMNRIDTKFVTTVPVLRRLLMLAKEDYFVQETQGLRISPYYTLYFDTRDEAEKVLNYIKVTITNRGRISKYELDLIEGKQANITEMDQGWIDISSVLIRENKIGTGYCFSLPRPRKWFDID